MKEEREFQSYVVLYDSKTQIVTFFYLSQFQSYVVLYDSKTVTWDPDCASTFQSYVVLYDSKTAQMMIYDGVGVLELCCFV